MNLDIIPADNIDYGNVAEVCGYQLLMCTVFGRAGGFDYPPVVNATLINVCNEGILWLGNVKTLIDSILDAPSNTLTLTLADIPELLASYDFFHRVSYGEPCFDYIKNIRLATVQKWLKGDKNISQTDVVLLIADEINRDIHRLDQRYCSFCFRVQQEWVDELVRFGRFRNIPLAEAYQRLSHLLRQDLMAYVGNAQQAKLKDKWAATYRVSDPTRLDTAALKAYIPFARTVSDLKRLPISDLKRLPIEDSAAEYETLAAELSSRPDVHPFFRQALSLDLAKFALA